MTLRTYALLSGGAPGRPYVCNVHYDWVYCVRFKQFKGDLRLMSD